MMKSSIAKVPESDQKELDEAKESVGNLAGGTMQNPLGEFVSLTDAFREEDGEGMYADDVICWIGG